MWSSRCERVARRALDLPQAARCHAASHRGHRLNRASWELVGADDRSRRRRAPRCERPPCFTLRIMMEPDGVRALRYAFSALLVVMRADIAVQAAPAADGIDKIRHVVIIMQENRSFDS